MVLSISFTLVLGFWSLERPRGDGLQENITENLKRVAIPLTLPEKLDITVRGEACHSASFSSIQSTKLAKKTEPEFTPRTQQQEPSAQLIQ